MREQVNLEFKTWIKETATSSACVAGFARPMMGMVTKPKLLKVGEDDKKKKKK